MTDALSTPRVAVVGAGAFGGWTAYHLQRRGANVTLVDAWGAGHSRSSSGDETRLIRTVYDGKIEYMDMAARALALWSEAEDSWQRPLLFRTGVLYLFGGADDFATRSLPHLRTRGVTVDLLTPDEGASRFPQISFDGIRTAYFEPDAGVLLARASCELVRETIEREGGTYIVAAVQPIRGRSGRLDALTTTDGRIEADAFVIACGPWLGTVVPDAVGDGIVATRQDVFYFGTPAGDARFDPSSFPGWIYFGDGQRWYGMAANERRGIKVADDVAGPAIDPSSVERIVTERSARQARAFVSERFPLLADQPVIETRVCQYEYSPDADFLLDRHPELTNVWLAGGGSGHGFKMGPALGEHVANLVLTGAVTPDRFSYAHFARGRDRARREERPRLHW